MNKSFRPLLLSIALLSSCATTGVPTSPPGPPVVSGSPVPTAVQTINNNKIHFNVIHGLLESQDSDQAGLHTLGADLLAIYPGSTLTEYKQDVYDVVPFQAAGICQVDIGNSWGFSAIMRRLDKNSNQAIALAVGFDGVPNPVNKPTQTADGDGWRHRTNAGYVLNIHETESVLKGKSLRPDSMVWGTTLHDWSNGYLVNVYPGQGTDYTLDWDPGVGPAGDFMAHFEILTKHAWVRPVVLQTIAQAIAGCK